MRRVFGKAKSKAPAYTLDDATGSVSRRGDVIDGKIAKLDEELQRYKIEMKKEKKRGQPLIRICRKGHSGS